MYLYKISDQELLKEWDSVIIELKKLTEIIYVSISGFGEKVLIQTKSL